MIKLTDYQLISTNFKIYNDVSYQKTKKKNIKKSQKF